VEDCHSKESGSLPVELLCFFGDLYLDPILFCNTSSSQPWSTTPTPLNDCRESMALLQDFGLPPGGDGLAEYSPRSAMFITPGALELVRFLAGSLLVSLGDMVRPLTAESTWEISDVSADMVAVL
jgi:hypothetical protein